MPEELAPPVVAGCMALACLLSYWLGRRDEYRFWRRRLLQCGIEIERHDAGSTTVTWPVEVREDD